MAEEPSSQPQATTPSRKSFISSSGLRIIGLSLGVLSIGFAIAYGGYFYYRVKQNTASQPASVQISPTPSSIPVPSVIDSNTVSFTRVNGTLYLQFKGRVYQQITEHDAQIVESFNTDAYTWTPLVQAPDNTTDSFFSQVFNFRELPANKGFIFIIRWEVPKANDLRVDEFTTYLYSQDQANPVTKLFSTTLPNEQNAYSVPIVNKISPDGRYIAFNMFSCWNCGGHTPETMLLDLQTKQTKHIGQTSFFAWKQNGAYEFKAYKEIPCQQEGSLPCPIDTTVPNQTGSL